MADFVTFSKIADSQMEKVENLNGANFSSKKKKKIPGKKVKDSKSSAFCVLVMRFP